MQIAQNKNKSVSSFVENLFRLSASSFWKNAVELVLNYLKASILGPALLGLTKTASIVETYAGYNDFGVIFGLNLELPIARGKGDKQLANNLKNTAFTLTIFFTCISLLMVVAAYLMGWNWKGKISITLLLLILFLIITNRADAFLYFLLRAENRFDVASKKQFLESLLTPLLGIPMLILCRVEGVLLSLILVRAISAFAVIRWLQLKLKFQLNLIATRILFKVGILTFATNLQNRLIRGLELLVIAQMLTPSDLGLFGFALSALAIIDVVPEAARQIIFQRMAFDQGRFGSESYSHQLHYYKAPFVLYLMITILLGGVGYLIYSFLTPLLLDQYSSTILLFFILVVGEVFYKVRIYTVISLTALKRLKLIFIIQGIALLVNFLLDIHLVKSGLGIMGTAIGSTVSYIFFALIYLTITFFSIGQPIRKGINLFLKLSLASLFCFAIIWALNSIALPISNKTDYASISINALFSINKIILFTILAVLTFIFLFRQYNIRNEIISRAAPLINNLKTKLIFN